MSAEPQPSPDSVTDALDALTERVDTLSAMVREATGTVAANRGEVSSLDRRVQELIGAGSEQTSAQLVALRRELDAVRGFIAEAPNRSGNASTAASDPLRETIAELGTRIDTLAEVVRSTSGRMVGEHNRTSELAEALAKQDARAEARFAEIQARLEAVSAKASEVLAAPAPHAADPGLEKRVAGKVDALVERVDFLRDTATETAGKLAATDGKLRQVEQRGEETIARMEKRSDETLARTEGAVRSMRGDLEAFKERLQADPMLEQRMDGLLDSVEALGTRVGTLSGIVGETVGRVSGRELEIAALDRRLEEVGHRVEHVARQLRHEIDTLGAVRPGEDASGADRGAETEAFGEQLAVLESSVAETAGVAEQLGIDLRREITSLASAVAKEHAEVVDATRTLEARGLVLESRMDTLTAFASSSAARGSEEVEALAAAVARKHADVLEVTQEWEARRADLEARMDDLAAVATSTAERGAEEIGRTLTTLAERLERLERDRRAVATDATQVETTWEQERAALEIRLDEIAATITVERRPAPDVELLVEELADRLARIEGERETVADLAALADAWTSELATLEARVDEGLATLEVQGAATSGVEPTVAADPELSDNVFELAQRIEQIERDRDAVRAELARTATSWASERAALQERVSELAARIVTGPALTASGGEDVSEHSPQELDRLRIGVEGLRMRLAYHEKTVSDLAGSRGVVQRLDELSARLDQLAAIVAAQAAPAGTATTGEARLFEFHTPETAGLLSRLDEADRLRSESREKMLEQMEKIASRMDWRLQRLEAEGAAITVSSN